MRNHKSGFSLVELMIVVAMVGVVAAIAVPSFQILANRSKQSEVKANLSILSQTEKSFWAETAQFTTRLDAMGFNPEGDQYYVYGFNASPDVPPPASFVVQGTNTCYNTTAGGSTTCAFDQGLTSPSSKWKNRNTATNITAFPAGTVQSTSNYTAVAAANFNGTKDDIWSIDDQNTVTYVQPGL